MKRATLFIDHFFGWPLCCSRCGFHLESGARACSSTRGISGNGGTGTYSGCVRHSERHAWACCLDKRAS